jgi:hypothetical protein
VLGFLLRGFCYGVSRYANSGVYDGQALVPFVNDHRVQVYFEDSRLTLG